MEHVQVEEVDEGKTSVKRKKRTMAAIQKNVMQGWDKGMKSLVNWADVLPKKSRQQFPDLQINTHKKW